MKLDPTITDPRVLEYFKTLEKRFSKIHKNKYCYEKSIYKNSHTPIEIVCPEHGSFFQKPMVHLRGNGCPICAQNKIQAKNSVTKEDFLIRSKNIHGSKYTYNLENYKSLESKIKIICPEHGEFIQKAGLHVSKTKPAGCPECGKQLSRNKRRNPPAEIIKKFKKVHGEKYNYSKMKYSHVDKKIEIICKKHGSFFMTPTNHIQGQGCRECSKEKLQKMFSKTKDQFIAEAKAAHAKKNKFYDYSLVDYKNLKTKVEIICPEHGIFKQRPVDHLNGQGCPICAQTGFDPQKPAILYYLKDLKTGLYKIGITNREVEKRFCSKRAIAILEQWEFEIGQHAWDKEQQLLEEFKQYRIVNEDWPENIGGKTEFFVKDILDLDDDQF